MPHLSVVALSNRLSVPATGCFELPVIGGLWFWASSGALGVLLIVFRREVFSKWESGAEL